VAIGWVGVGFSSTCLQPGISKSITRLYLQSGWIGLGGGFSPLGGYPTQCGCFYILKSIKKTKTKKKITFPSTNH